MTIKSLIILFPTAAAAFAISTSGVENMNSQTNQTPNIIPAPQKWKAASGTFEISTAAITAAGQHPDCSVQPIINLLKNDLASIGISSDRTNSSAGKITFTLTDKQIGKGYPGGYTLQITPAEISVTAPDATGIFHASQSILQMAMQSKNIPCGTITDYPAYRIRALMLDTARKFFPYETLKDYIRLMGFLKMSELHLHLSDNSFGEEIYPSFRIECESMPQLTNKDGFYTKTQIRELQQFAKLRGITITPEIDAPGHAFCFTRLRPDLRNPKLGDAYLDVTNPGTIELMKMIFDEFIPLFDAPDIHIGTDEYRRGHASKEEWEKLGEGFRLYINTMNRHIREKHGKNVRIWSGWEHMPGTTQPDKNIIIDMWVSSDAKTKSAEGYKYINSNHGRTYIVPGAGYYGVSNVDLYNGWTPAVFTGKKDCDPAPDDPNLLGGKLHVWNDMGPNGYTMYEIADLTIPSLFVMSEKMWGTKGSADYNAFKKRVAAIGLPPGINLLKRGIQAIDDSGLVFDSGDKVYQLKTPTDSFQLLPYLGGADDAHKNLEFPWTATMQIKPADGTQQQNPAVILSSRIAELQADLRYTTTHRDRKTKQTTTTDHKGIGFSRLDKYSSTPLRGTSRATRAASGELLPSGKFSTLTFVGNRRSTRIYLNGRPIATVTGSRAQSICPLEFIGAYPGRGGGFVGTIKKLRIYNKTLTPKEVATLSGIIPPRNIAKGCKVTATKSDVQHSLLPEKLTDGNTESRNSRWSSGPTRNPVDLTLDLGGMREIGKLRLYWEKAYPQKYAIALSTDGRHFDNFETANGKPNMQEHDIGNVSTRFISVIMSDPATQWGYSLYEIEALAPPEKTLNKP